MPTGEDVNERPKVGIGVAIRKNGQILIGHRKGDHAGGEWSFPGGHLEYGEDPVDCALRETAEECGITISPPWLGLVTNNVFSNGRHYITLIMIADWVAGTPQVLEPDKVINWQWCAWSALPAPLIAPIVSLQKNGFDPTLAQQQDRGLLAV